ncbi:MAG: glycosyltransferase family 2 protein [Lachnospiraceae bacterium]|nr:glycosyltransferase family 2 protein [Lachnospiraceae bacterium]
MKTLIIIPAYNEEASIEYVINKLISDCPDADYVVINDCSKDNTLEVLKRCRANYLNSPLNLGIGGGVQMGYKYALSNGYDIAIQIDGDGQHDTSFVKDVVNPIEAGEADIVIGSRFIEKQGFQSSGMRRFGIKFLSGLIRLCCGAKVSDVTSGFRAVNRRYIEIYAQEYPTDYPEPEAIVKAAVTGARIREIPVIMKERETGTSSITPFKSIYYMIKVSLAILLCRISNRRK